MEIEMGIPIIGAIFLGSRRGGSLGSGVTF